MNMAFIKKLLSSSIKKLIFSMIFITLGDWWRLEIFMMDVDSSAKKPDENQPDENQPDENQPDHDMPDVGDNAEAPDGRDNPPAPHGENNPPAPHGPNIQPIGPEQQPEAVPPEIENPHGHPQGAPHIHHPEPAQGNQEPAQGNQDQDRREPLERSGKKRKLSEVESRVATSWRRR